MLVPDSLSIGWDAQMMEDVVQILAHRLNLGNVLVVIATWTAQAVEGFPESKKKLLSLLLTARKGDWGFQGRVSRYYGGK